LAVNHIDEIGAVKWY